MAEGGETFSLRGRRLLRFARNDIPTRHCATATLSVRREARPRKPSSLGEDHAEGLAPSPSPTFSLLKLAANAL